jgi:hypothetical protein
VLKLLKEVVDKTSQRYVGDHKCRSQGDGKKNKAEFNCYVGSCFGFGDDKKDDSYVHGYNQR